VDIVRVYRQEFRDFPRLGVEDCQLVELAQLENQKFPPAANGDVGDFRLQLHFGLKQLGLGGPGFCVGFSRDFFCIPTLREGFTAENNTNPIRNKAKLCTILIFPCINFIIPTTIRSRNRYL
jgi:hypothetical protein